MKEIDAAIELALQSKRVNDYKDSDRLKDDLGLDRLDVIEFIMGLEKALNIGIPDRDISEIESMNVGQVREYLKERVQK